MDTQILIYSPVYGLIAVLTLDNANYGLTQQFIKQCLIYERLKIYNFFRLPLTTLYAIQIGWKIAMMDMIF